ncbi:short-chain dehydrogenase [Algimonas ampicilliniresistens]|uniref:Short-chain dehydrogenase n=1 Tax=Algimonas ampicilliniresistens TaxID=1298735 RepID=A0ABQ5V727_9PROT|nr:SDR family oxidoreductase [Algimonas ampicilliniresistens]GLQ23205.1 short-chain dehydrogenase [Algimonas ampicilliniresistens]
MDYTGKSVFITGSARGIGQGLAIAFAKSGCKVIGCDLRADTQVVTKERVEAEGGTYNIIEADLSKVEEAVVATEEAMAIGFDILINNAGIATSGEYDAVPFERWRKTIDLNVTGLMAVTHTALPHLREREAAHIINMSSIAGVIGSPGMAAYTASKHAVRGFTRCLEYDLDGTTIGVTSIHPSMVRTRMIDGVARSKTTPAVEIEDVVSAILKAISRNQSQVFIPKSTRWAFDIGSRLFPGLTRRTMRGDGLQGWKTADKGVPDA